MLDRLFLQVLDMSLTASYVILFILLVRIVLQKAPKIYSYALWSIALFRLICPWSFESDFSLFTIRDTAVQQLQSYPGLPTMLDSVRTYDIVPNGNTVVPTRAVDTFSGLFVENMITVLWLIGIVILLIYSIVTLFKLKKQLRGAVCEKDNIYLSKNLSTPFVMGVIRPKIYLPQFLSGVEKGYILLHEQTHIRRLDHVVKLVSFFVLCIHWFNPLVWAAFFYSSKDMEMSCDETVIKKLGNGVKKEYSSSLLSLATGRRIVGGTPLAFGEGDVKRRIKNVLHYKKPALWMAAAVLIAVLSLSVGLMTNPLSSRASMQWAENLKVDDIETIELVAMPGEENEQYQLFDRSEYTTLVSLINQSHGTYIKKPENLEGSSTTLYISLTDGTRHSVSNSGNAYLIIDGDFYEAEYVWLSNWPHKKGDSSLPTDLIDHSSPSLNTNLILKNELSFWIKPDEPAEVIGDAAAHIWLKSYMEETTPPVERIVDYAINAITVSSAEPKEGQAWEDMNYHHVVRVNYSITTASEEYSNPSDLISGKGKFDGLSRELYVRDVDKGNFSIVSIGTGSGE